jgi:hypothetical protein
VLLGNGVRDSRNPLQRRGLVPGGESENFVRSGLLRNFHGQARGDGESLKSSRPSGLRHPYTWSLPTKAGAVASRNEIITASALVGSGAMGVNGDATIAGSATLDGIGQLVVSALATITAGGTLSGNIVAALQAAAALAGAGSVTAAVDALAWAVAAANGSASLSATPYATGQLDAAIAVGATEGLTAAQVAEQVLDSELVEIGLTVRGALRLIAAASAGEVAISGDTVTIRSAVADSKNRIVATTDAQGQRTAITFDLTDG